MNRSSRIDDPVPGEVFALITAAPTGDVGVYLKTDYGAFKAFMSPQSAKRLAMQLKTFADQIESSQN